jgi:Tol biopolymer transport system component
MPSPNFLIIGAQKSGSSWLAAHLRKHPDVFMARGELHFFDKELNFARGREWYEAHFAGATHQRAIGEKTPDYLWANGVGAEGHLPDVHRNIRAYYPDVKMILVMRNPVARAVSAVHHIIRSGRCSPLYRIDRLLVGDKRHLVEPHGIIQKGRYHEQITAYLKCFRREQFLFLLFEEDVLKTPHETLRRVCTFIDVDPGFDFGMVTRAINEFNRSIPGLVVSYYFRNAQPVARFLDRHLPQHKRKPKPETLGQLHALYAEENEKLFALLGRRTEAWTAPVAPRRRPAVLAPTGGRGWAAPAWRLGAAAVVLALAAVPVYWAVQRNSAGDRALAGEYPMATGSHRTVTRLTATTAIEESPAWSPDGQRLAYVANANGRRQVFVRGVAGGEVRRVSRHPADEIQPTWSADGQHLAFVRARATDQRLEPSSIGGRARRAGDIWTLDLATGEERKLIENAFAPAYSPDGKRLAFDASRGGLRRIWMADVNGDHAQPVTHAAGSDVIDADPEWSPDGTKLVFRRTERGQTDIVVLDLASAAVIKLTDDDPIDRDAVWSGSGRYIYFSSSRGGGLDLWRIEVGPDGRPVGQAEQLTRGLGDEMEPALAPDGRRVAFTVRDIELESDAPPLVPEPVRSSREGGRRVLEAGSSPSAEDRWAPFGSTRRGGDLWVLDGV